jgi:iron complex transport system ATP-binding protein
MIEARDVRFAYRGRPVLVGASLSLAPGELVCLLGANGAGKSTLLKVMLGLLSPPGGAVLLDGRHLADWGRREVAKRVAYVPQVHAAPFPYSVREIVLMGRMPANGLFKAPTVSDRAAADRVIERLGIGHLAARSYTEISGGERQLTLIARAMAQEARLLVMDEPMAGLDFGNQLRLLERLDGLVEDGYGVLMTTHDPDQALGGCNRVAMLIDGRIAADGDPISVLTTAAIERLYGVRVELLRAAGGAALAFRPQARSHAC